MVIRSAIRSSIKKFEKMATVTTDEKFLFDLNGYIHLRNVLNTEEVDALNASINANIDKSRIRESQALKNTKKGTQLSAPGSRIDMGGMLGWDAPHGDPWRNLLAHPKIVKYLNEFCGEGYRLDHQPLVIVQDRDSEGFSLHGGPLTGNGNLNPELQYRCFNGNIWNSLLAMSVCLSPSKQGDGGFCVLRGSHKLNFPVSNDFANGISSAFNEHVYQPEVNIGDIILFSEATVHGAMSWKAQHQRRLAIYRFSPPNYAYGRGYLDKWGEGVLEKCDEAQAAVLAAPYAPRLDRPLLNPDNDSNNIKISIQSRSDEKKEHDLMTFKTKYF